VSNASLVGDETAGIDNNSGDKALSATPADFKALGTVISWAQQSGMVSTTGTSYGADGAGVTKVTLTQSTGADFTGQDSGLKTLDNTAIKLYTENGMVVGKAGSTVVFALSIDNTGTVSMAQYQAIKHGDTTDANDIMNIKGVFATVTATDHDGDKVSTTTSKALDVAIRDDAPTLTSQPATATVSEADLRTDHNPTGFVQAVFKSLNVNWGADKAGAHVDFATNAQGQPLHPDGLTSDGVSLSYALRTTQSGESQLVAFKSTETINNPVFIVALTSPTNPSYGITLFQNIDHAANSDTTTLKFTVVATDGDGDHIDINVNVAILDDKPIIGTVEHESVSETALPLTFGDEILADTANSAVQKGDLAISWGADDRNGSGNIDRSVSFGSFAAPANLTSDGQTITYSFNSDKTVLTASAGPGHTVIFTVSLSDSGSGEYTFRLYGNIDHATDSKTLDFGFVARDADGDAVTGTISVDILDGGPQIGNVENETVNESALPTDLIDVILADTPYSTVQVGNLAVDWGADSNNSGVSNNRSLAFSGIVNGAPSGLTHDGVAIVYTLSQNNTVLTAKAGGTEIFTVSLSDDGTGSYTFVLKDSIDHTSGNGTSATLSFGFTATDSDGDAAKSSFSVSIIDDTPEAHTPSIRTLEEASGSPAISNVSLGIDWKSDDGPARDVRFTNLSTAAANISNAASLTSSGQPLSYALIAGILVAYIGSQPADAHADNVVFSVALSKDGSGAYSFTLNQPLDQTSSISGNDHFTDITVSYSAIDSDGDADKASFTVRVDAAGVISNQNHDISYADLTSGVFVNLDNSAATYAGQTVGADKATDTSAVTDKVVGIDNVGGIVNVTGSKGSDVIIGGAEDNVLKGGAGNDIIDGRGGTDKLYGEDGDDRLIGGAGNDVLDGGTNTTVGFTVPGTPTSDGAAAILASVHGGDTADYSGSSVNIIANLGDAANWPVTIGAHQATGEGTDTLNGIESVAGGSGNDVIFGDGSANILVGGAGSDNIFGGAGNDLLYGGDDTVGDGLFAGAGDDVLILGNGGGTAKGEGGNDLIYGGTGNDYLYGEDDGNPNPADAGNDTIFAGAGNDYIEGDGGNDKLYGEDGNDTIVGGAGNDTIDGGAGDDTIVYALGDGADIVDGGIGNDTLKVTTPNGGPTLIEYISATGGNLLLSPTDSTIANLEVEKTLTARNVETLDIDVTGNNWLVFGQGGSDLASSGLQTVKITGDDNGNSVYFSNVSSATKLEASLNGGNDSFVAGGQAINQQVDGGSGVDLFDFSQISQQLSIDLAAGTAIRSSLNGATVIATDAITNFENVTGSVGNDTILGTDGANVLSGGDGSAGTGNDIINGRGGDDIIDGGDGNDTLEGGTGSDTLYGGAGNDTFILGTDVIGSGTRVLDLGNGTFQTVSIDGLAGTADVVSGGTGYDKIVLDAGSASGYVHDTYSATGYISGVEEITGTSGNDVIMVASSYQSDAAGGGITIDGGAGNDAIGGGAGNDTLLGGDGDDLISGLSGDDTLEGGAGNDTLYGGTGNDILRGGADNDVMYGGDGVDRLDGGAGNDILIGGKGDDALIGGAGNDLFKYSVGDGNDRINGGSETGTEAPNYDILEITGDAEQRSFSIGQLAQASAGNIAPYPAETDLNDVTVSYTGTNTATIRADEIERIVINTGSAGDTVTVGDLTGTAIAPATIVINSGSGSDTIDLTALAGTKVEINDADPSGSGDIDTVKLAGHWTDYTVTQASDGTFSIARGEPSSQRRRISSSSSSQRTSLRPMTASYRQQTC
jgi:T1SS-143 domain-containing protein